MLSIAIATERDLAIFYITMYKISQQMWRRGRTRPWSACGSSSSPCAGGRRDGVGDTSESEYLLLVNLTITWYKNGVNKANLWVKEGEDHDWHEVLTKEDGQGEGVLHDRTGPPLNTNRVAAKWWFKCLNVRKTYEKHKHCSTNTKSWRWGSTVFETHYNAIIAVIYISSTSLTAFRHDLVAMHSMGWLSSCLAR